MQVRKEEYIEEKRGEWREESRRQKREERKEEREMKKKEIIEERGEKKKRRREKFKRWQLRASRPQPAMRLHVLL
jgi:hypothetical protein